MTLEMNECVQHMCTFFSHFNVLSSLFSLEPVSDSNQTQKKTAVMLRKFAPPTRFSDSSSSRAWQSPYDEILNLRNVPSSCRLFYGRHPCTTTHTATNPHTFTRDDTLQLHSGNGTTQCTVRITISRSSRSYICVVATFCAGTTQYKSDPDETCY